MSHGFDEWEGKRVLITGATGFVGYRLAHLGVTINAQVHTYGRQAVKELERPYHMRFHQGTMEDAERVREVVQLVKPAGIVHLAAAGVAYGGHNAAALCRTNVEGLAHLLEAAAQLPKPPIVVCAGSGFEYAPLDRARKETDPTLPNSVYGASKAAATALAAAYATRLPITVLRPFSIYGADEPPNRLAAYIVAKARAGEPIELTGGEQLRDYLDVFDVAMAFWQALLYPPEIGAVRVLNLASGRVVTLREFVEILAAALRRKGLVPDLRFGARPYRSDEMMNYTADISAWQAQIPWVPSFTLEDGLANLVQP